MVDSERMTRGSIIAEARALLNEDGLDKLSLRRLAARLGVTAAALYWHFPDKGALLSALLEALFYEVLESLPPHRDWQRWMRAFGHAVWRAKDRARDFTQLVATSTMSRRDATHVTEKIRARLRPLALPENNAMRLQSSIQAVVIGWSAFARAPLGKELGLDIEAQVFQDIDALIAAECMRRGEAYVAPDDKRVANA